MAAGVFAVTRGMDGVNRFPIKFGDEDMQDGIQHRFRRAFKKVREADKNALLAQADGAIDVGKAIEADFKFRHRRTGAQIAICLFKNLGDGGSHLDQKLAANARE
jgi:hypothetical protein